MALTYKKTGVDISGIKSTHKGIGRIISSTHDIRLIEDSFANVVKIYSLTIKGRYFYSKLLPYFDEKPDQKPDKIKELVGRYQKDKTNNKLIDFVYKNYEKYTTNSLIKNRVEKRWKDQN